MVGTCIYSTNRCFTQQIFSKNTIVQFLRVICLEYLFLTLHHVDIFEQFLKDDKINLYLIFA